MLVYSLMSCRRLSGSGSEWYAVPCEPLGEAFPVCFATTLNVYTHLRYDDVEKEVRELEERFRKEV